MPLTRRPTTKRDVSSDLVERKLPQCKVHGCSSEHGAAPLVHALRRARYTGPVVIQWPVQHAAQQGVSRVAAARVSKKCRKRSLQGTSSSKRGVLTCRDNSSVPAKHVGDSNVSSTKGHGGQFAAGFLGKVDVAVSNGAMHRVLGVEVNGPDHQRTLTQVQDELKENGANWSGLQIIIVRSNLQCAQLDAAAHEIVANLSACTPGRTLSQ